MRLPGLTNLTPADFHPGTMAKQGAHTATLPSASSLVRQFQNFSNASMAKLYSSVNFPGASGALQTAITNLRGAMTQLQGGLMHQLNARLGGAGHQGAGQLQHYRPQQHQHQHQQAGRPTLPGMSMPWGGSMSLNGPFYHPSGMQLHFNGVSAGGTPMMTTLDLMSGKLNSQTPWQHNPSTGLMTCRSFDHSTGKSWAWMRNNNGVSGAVDNWATGKDGIQRRNMCVFVSGKPAMHFTQELNPATGSNRMHSDWFQDKQGATCRINIDLKTSQRNVEYAGAQQAHGAGPEAQDHTSQVPPASGPGPNPRPQAPPVPHPQPKPQAASQTPPPPTTDAPPRNAFEAQQQMKKAEMKSAYQRFGLVQGAPISDDQLKTAEKQYKTAAMKHHPNRHSARLDDKETDAQMKQRQASNATQFQQWQHDYQLIKEEHARLNGKN